MTQIASTPIAHPHDAGPVARLLQAVHGALSRIPDSLIAIVARFSIAAVFWKSGQTKIEALAIDIVNGEFRFGWPHLSNSALYLFKEEYSLPFVSPNLAAHAAAFSEHLFPLLIRFGLATRRSAAALLGMTLTIQLFVYPGAYPAHGVWATVVLFLLTRGAGALSLDHWIGGRVRQAPDRSAPATSRRWRHPLPSRA